MKKISWNDGWSCSQEGQFLSHMQKESSAGTIMVPHDAQIRQKRNPHSVNGPDGAWYDGDTYVYIKTFTAPAEWRRRKVLICFEGVSRNCSVFVNGQFTGKCPDPYSRFFVSIGKFLSFDSTNEVRVVARNGMQQTGRWYVGGGILRPVWLLVGEKVYLEPNGVRVTTIRQSGSYATVDVSAKIRHEEMGSRSVSLHLSLTGPDGVRLASETIPITLMDSETVTVSSRMDVEDPPLWDLEKPNLCRLSLTLSDRETIFEEKTVPFGIRTLTVDHTRGMCVNGKPVKLRGACIHSDNGLLGGVSLPDAEYRKARRLKEAGFNAVRSAHNAASDAFLSACDKVGLLVMDELFDVWNESKRSNDSSLTFAEWWQSEMEDIVAKDYNHPSVVLYTLGNEIPETGTPGGAALNRQMAGYFRSLDPTRPIVNCINGMFSVMPRMREILSDVTGESAENLPADINELMTLFDRNIDQIMQHRIVTEATEETFYGADVCGYNYMASRYQGDGEAYPNRIIVGSETAPDRIGFHWPIVEKLNYVLGDFCWTGWDYIGEAGVGKNDYQMTHAMYGPWPWFLAYCGDIDLIGDRRPQSYYREIAYGIRKTPYLCVERPEHYGQPRCTTNWTWPDVIESWTWPGFEGKQIHAEVYADADEVVLQLNGEEIAREAVGNSGFPYKAVFNLHYMPGELSAVSLKKGVATGTVSLRTAETAKAIAIQADRRSAPADGMSLFYLEISLVDEYGQLNRSHDREITVSVHGPVELGGFGSAKPDSLEGFYECRHQTFDGRALLVLRTIMGQPGEIAVEATAEDEEGYAGTDRARLASARVVLHTEMFG